ncbi:MAG: SoxR reducing system RseC family protein, partial [Christensenellaceae bacterium]
MVERGTVVGINGGDVDVMFKRTSACGKCCACGMMVGSDEMTIPLKNTIGAT